MYLGNQPALSYTSFAKQDFTVTATTSYTLDHSVSNENEIALFINFVRQEPTTAYTASGTSLTLTEATSVGDDMYCVFIGKAVQTVTPADNTITNSMLQSGSFSNITDVGTLSSGLTVSDNILFDTASKGIYLGVTTPTDSNLLDDYEEGTWTPSFEPSSGSFTSFTDGSNIGATYTRIGNVCHISCFYRTNAITKGSASGTVRLAGLPFTAANGFSPMMVGYAINFAGDEPFSGLPRNNFTNMSIYYKTSSNGNSLALNVTDLGTGNNDNNIYIGGVYKVL